MAEVLLKVPTTLRSRLSTPFGPIFASTDALESALGTPVLAVGDAVTASLIEAGIDPHLAIVDGQTEREPIDTITDETIEAAKAGASVVEVSNPAGTLTRSLLEAIKTAITGNERTVIAVDGEEDLATLAVVLAAPDHASVVYGQPGEGIVHVVVTEERRDRCNALFTQLDGSIETAKAILA